MCLNSLQRTGSSHAGSHQHRANGVDGTAYGDMDSEDNVDSENNIDSQNNIASRHTIMQHVIRREGNSTGEIRANPSQS